MAFGKCPQKAHRAASWMEGPAGRVPRLAACCQTSSWCADGPKAGLQASPPPFPLRSHLSGMLRIPRCCRVAQPGISGLCLPQAPLHTLGSLGQGVSVHREAAGTEDGGLCKGPGVCGLQAPREDLGWELGTLSTGWPGGRVVPWLRGPGGTGAPLCRRKLGLVRCTPGTVGRRGGPRPGRLWVLSGAEWHEHW